MSVIWGNIIVMTLLAVIVVLAARYLWKSRKTGGRCTGNCASCGRCHGSGAK